MLWPFLVEYTEPGMPGISYLQQQGNMALFLTLFIVTCVEVLIVKVAQSERELEIMLTPHDPPYANEYDDDDDDDEDEDDDICKVRASLYEEELRSQKRFLIKNSYLPSDDEPNFRETKKAENGFPCALNENNLQKKINQNFQNKSECATQCRSNETNLNVPKKEDPNSDTIKVRELIEKMVEAMIEGPLDGTSVGQLSTHSAYKNAFEVDSSDLKHSNLKRLIKRIVSEAMVLPNIKENLCAPKTLNKSGNDDFKGKSYEDILATAILNKIIDNFQNKNYVENGKTDENSKPKLRNKKIRKNDDIKSDDDWSDTSRSDQLSLTIEEYIEEVTTTVEGSDLDSESDFSDFETCNNRRIPFPESGKTVVEAGADDENSDFEEQNAATQLISSTNSWEENWLFQKKRLRSTPNAHHPVPVPMLVPNPSEDFRALVGGVDADDLSDISDCNDKFLEDLITTEEKPSAQHLNTECETQEELDNSAAKNGTEELKEMQIHAGEEFFCEEKKFEILKSEVRNTNENDSDGVLKENKKCSALKTDEDVEQNSSILNVSEVLSQKDRDSSIEDFSHQYESINSLSPSEGAIQNSPTTEGEDGQIICPLAEKEKEKWMNPIPLADNPYSLENINKREQRKKNEYFRIGTYTGESVDFPDDLSQDEFSKKETEKLRFSRDYYVNASKHPSGMSSPSFNQHSEEYDQVSTNSYEALTSMGCSGLERKAKYNSYPNIAEGSAIYFTLKQQPNNWFLPLQNQTMRRRHFSEVFKTSTVLNSDSSKSKTLKKYRHGSCTLKTRPKVKEAIFRKLSLERELFDFEQKSLREDLKHSLLRARGASPNFILNPVFNPEGFNSSEIELKKTKNYKSNLRHSDTEFDESDFIKPSKRRESDVTASGSYKAMGRMSHESGYGSDSLDYSSDSLECWRLTPPKTPEVVETSFISIARNRKDKENLHKTFSNGNTVATHPEKNNKFKIQKMQDKQNNETTQYRIIDKSQFSLPSVKELAKQFATEDSKMIKNQNGGLQTKLESKHKIQILSTNDDPEKEPEIDYSPVPVSEIILNLRQSTEAPARENCHKPIIYNHALPTTCMEIFRKADSNLIIKNHTENIKMPEQTEAARFNGKEVHSLTARSISKKFREGLKNNSYQKVCLKINGISSSGESNQGSIMSNKMKTSPTPSIDLKNMKKFWEEIITANSNTTKQK